MNFERFTFEEASLFSRICQTSGVPAEPGVYLKEVSFGAGFFHIGQFDLRLKSMGITMMEAAMR